MSVSNSAPVATAHTVALPLRLPVQAISGYGIDAIRSDGRGGYNAGVLFQYNFGKNTFASDRAFEELRGARVPIR